MMDVGAKKQEICDRLLLLRHIVDRVYHNYPCPLLDPDPVNFLLSVRSLFSIVGTIGFITV